MSVALGDTIGTSPSLRAPAYGRTAVSSKSVESADTALRRAVLARLIADPLVSTGHVGVAAISGRVILSGYVTSNAQKGAAAAATRRVKGVQEVADDVRVAVPCPYRTEPPADALEAPAAPAAGPSGLSIQWP